MLSTRRMGCCSTTDGRNCPRRICGPSSMEACWLTDGSFQRRSGCDGCGDPVAKR
ncbi:unnamed protein product [Symbiodinium necroappetens]|uniref:Uncharacterized protein n=1 Tax=Symbiodinium necroappetens TaxID=1628268 RepID=A0A813AGV3_9DINO|nr:unnamed protein product [Symbiodinium necroappetens]